MRVVRHRHAHVLGRARQAVLLVSVQTIAAENFLRIVPRSEPSPRQMMQAQVFRQHLPIGSSPRKQQRVVAAPAVKFRHDGFEIVFLLQHQSLDVRMHTAQKTRLHQAIEAITQVAVARHANRADLDDFAGKRKPDLVLHRQLVRYDFVPFQVEDNAVHASFSRSKSLYKRLG